MKSVIYFSSCLVLTVFFHSVGLSQITITTSDLPNYFGAGKSSFMYVYSDTGIAMDVGTANSTSAQTWTLPAVSFTDSSRMDNVVPSATPYAADFPGAAYAQTFNYADSSSSFVIYQYFKLSSDSLFGIGSAEHFHYSYHGYVHDTVYIYDTTEFYAHFPVQLGNNSGGSADTANFGGGSLEVTTSTNTIDAFGTLILPIGSFQALRQSTKAVHNFYYNSSLVNSYTSYSFTWFTREGHKLEVETDTAKSGTVNLTSLSVTYSETTPVSAVRTHREAPSGFALEQNYPNPFNPTTAIRFRTSEISHVTLAVYNLLGEKVATLVNEEKSPGTYQVQFDGSRLSSGVYFYTLRSGNYTATKRLLLMK